MITSYCCSNAEARDMSAAQNGAERQHLYVRGFSTYEDIVMVTKSSSSVIAETMETRRKVKELQKQTGFLAGSGSSRWRREVLDKIGSLLSG